MTAFPWSEKVAELQRQAAVKRTRGDALRRQGKKDEATVAFAEGVGFLDEALNLLGWPPSSPAPDPAGAAELSDEQIVQVKELVEVHGARAGLLRRAGDTQAALAGYSAGADLERRFAPESTYNRTNEIKLGLLTGARDLGSLSPDIDELERQITRALEKNPTLGDSGWAWADLGDLRALRGDGGGAERAYSTFIAKAKPTSPRTTLEVLSSILKVLDRQNDKRATTVRQSLEFVRGKLDLS
jgi:hypothetical protein